MELEDRYGIRMGEEEAERIKTVGQAIDFVLVQAPPIRRPEIAAFGPCSTSCPRASRSRRSRMPPGSTTARHSYERLAFLGDSVLNSGGLDGAVSTLQAPHGRAADQDPRADGQQALLRGGRSGAGRSRAHAGRRPVGPPHLIERRSRRRACWRRRWRPRSAPASSSSGSSARRRRSPRPSSSR